MCVNIQAVEIDGEHAVLVRDKSSGQVRLVTEKQLFIPGPNESIESLVCKTDGVIYFIKSLISDDRLAQEGARIDQIGRP